MRVGKVLIAATLVIVAGATAVLASRSFDNTYDPAAFTSVIAGDASVHPDSNAILDHVFASGVTVGALLRDAAVPVVNATPTSPRRTVTCTIREWGCPFDGAKIPVPAGAIPSGQPAASIVIIDRAAGKVYEMWQPKETADGVAVASGAITDLGGNGWGGGSTSSGASLLAGVIRVSDIAGGNIPHALALTTNYACASHYWSPATKTDGNDRSPNCIPLGTRLQLDPLIDLDALHLPPGVRTVARALQVYGGFVVGVGSQPLSVKFERDQTAAADAVGGTYDRAGLSWDYQTMSSIPWRRIRVLAPVSD